MYKTKNNVCELPIIDIRGNIESLIYKSTYLFHGSYKIEIDENRRVTKLIFPTSQSTYSGYEHDFIIFEYDKKGNNISAKKYGEEGLMFDWIGRIVEETVYQYNDFKNIIKGETYRFNGRIKKRFELIYDSNNRLIKEVIEDDMFGGQVVNYQYDHNNRIIEEEKICDKSITCLKNNFDSKGNLIRSVEEFWEDGDFYSQSVCDYEYNKGDLIIVAQVKSSDGTKIIRKFDYEFDKNNNWIKMYIHIKSIRNGELSENEYITGRIIKYKNKNET